MCTRLAPVRSHSSRLFSRVHGPQASINALRASATVIMRETLKGFLRLTTKAPWFTRPMETRNKRNDSWSSVGSLAARVVARLQRNEKVAGGAGSVGGSQSIPLDAG